MRNRQLALGNIIKRYEPFTIREAVFTITNEVVRYVVLVDDDSNYLRSGLEFGWIPLTKDEPDDNYFLKHLRKIIESQLKNNQKCFDYAKNLEQEILDGKKDELLREELLKDELIKEKILSDKRKYMKEKSDRIAFIKAAESKLKTFYPLV